MHVYMYMLCVVVTGVVLGVVGPAMVGAACPGTGGGVAG